MNKTFLTIEEAEDIVDNMYQKRWEECGIIDENAIHMGNLDNLEFTELEKASILLLRTELRLKRENKQLKQQLEQRDNIINKAREFIKENVYEQDNSCGDYWWEITDKDKLLEILNIDKGDE